MTLIISKIRPEVEDAIRAAIAKVMVDFPVRRCTIEAKLDHADEEAIFVDIHHDLVDRPFDPGLDAELGALVDERLFALGETRFPYLIHHFPDGQKVKGW